MEFSFVWIEVCEWKYIFKEMPYSFKARSCFNASIMHVGIDTSIISVTIRHLHGSWNMGYNIKFKQRVHNGSMPFLCFFFSPWHPFCVSLHISVLLPTTLYTQAPASVHIWWHCAEVTFSEATCLVASSLLHIFVLMLLSSYKQTSYPAQSMFDQHVIVPRVLILLRTDGPDWDRQTEMF